MASSNSNRDDFMSDINVTPLVDVMLVLLVVMMVATSYAVTRALKVDLPTSSATGQADKPIVIEIDKDGGTRLDGQGCTLDELRGGLRRIKDRETEPKALIAADGATAHHSVVRVMDVLREESINKVAIGVRPNP
jgi:biopolymer transport protein ExbD